MAGEWRFNTGVHRAKGDRLVRAIYIECFLSATMLKVRMRWLIRTVNSEIFAKVYFRETSLMRSFAELKSSQNGEVTLSLTDIGKSCPSREFKTSLICILTLFAKIKFSRKFSNLQYSDPK